MFIGGHSTYSVQNVPFHCKYGHGASFPDICKLPYPLCSHLSQKWIDIMARTIYKQNENQSTHSTIQYNNKYFICNHVQIEKYK